MEFLIFSDTWLIFVIAYIITTISLNLEAGFTGIPNFGKAVFVFMGAWAAQGIGIRIAAWIVEREDPQLAQEALSFLKEHLGREYPSLVAAAGNTDANRIVANHYIYPFLQDHPLIVVGLFVAILAITIVLAAVVGLMASYAALRLREEYLAILLLSFSELVVSVIFRQTEALNGGPKGLWGVKFAADSRLFALIFGTIIAILVFIYAERLAHSPMGRAMRAVRDDEIAAGVYGRDVAKIRLKVIMVSSVIAALAGLVYIEANLSAQSLSFDRVYWTFFPWAFLILGGMANNRGAVLGVIVFMILRRLIDYGLPQLAAGHSSLIQMGAAYFSNILVGSIILFVLYFRPQGLLPEKPSKTLDFHEILKQEEAL